MVNWRSVTVLCVVLIIFLFTSQVVCQSVTAVKDKITGELSGTAVFKWKVDRAQKEMIILALTLNRGATLNLLAILFRGISNPLQPEKEKNLDRLNATIFVVPDTDLELIYQLTLKNLDFSDKNSAFFLRATFESLKGGTKKDSGAAVTLITVNDPAKTTPTEPAKTSPKEPKEEKKSNAGKIAGGVVGGIIFLILVGIAIFLILRWKKNKGAPHCDESGKNLNSGYGTAYKAPQYADTSLALNKTRSKEPPSAQTYMDLGPGGGRIGERTNPPPQSHYREVKKEEDGPPKPKRGVTRRDSEGNIISDDVNV